MDRLLCWLVGTARWSGVGLFAVLTLTLFWSVAIRYFAVFGGSLPWVEEFARFTFIWMTFLGAVVALERTEHICIDLLVKYLRPHMQRIVAALVDGAVLAFLAVYTLKGIELVRLTADQTSPQLDLPMSLVHAVIPVTGAVMILQMIRFAVRRWRPLPGGAAPK